MRSSVNKEYVGTLSQKQIIQIKQLHDELQEKRDASIEELEFLAYQIPKEPAVAETELKKEQRAFFKDVYNLLIGKDTGPRLGTFLWAVDRDRLLELLTIES